MEDKLISKINKLLLNFNKKPIKKIEEWGKIAFSSKEDLLNLNYPKNSLEVRETSGSTGKSLFIYFSPLIDIHFESCLVFHFNTR